MGLWIPASPWNLGPMASTSLIPSSWASRRVWLPPPPVGGRIAGLLLVLRLELQGRFVFSLPLISSFPLGGHWPRFSLQTPI
jgi:hypothetical protein